jgi:GntR family transcriptional regulator
VTVSTDEAASHLGHLRPGDERPPYVQIAAHLRELIDSGRLGPGDRLPSESQLTEHYGVARMTVRSALNVLESAGLTIAQHGKGVFVRPRPSVRRLASDRFARRHREDGKAAFLAEAEKVGVRPTVDMIRVTREEVPADIAERLATSPGRPVVVRRRRYLMDGRPVETATSYIPADLAEGTAIEQPNTGPGGIYARLEEQGHRLGHFEEEVSVRMPTPDEVETLSLMPAVPVIHLIRTAVAADGRPVEVCDTIMAGDAYVLAYELPAR